MLTIPHCKECLSKAYVTAVVGRSQNKLIWTGDHDYGVDGYVRVLERDGDRIRETGQGFDFQSKTTVDWTLNGTDIVYDLEAQAYNDLVSRAGTNALPFLLIVLCLHRDDTTWLAISDTALSLQKCAFWYQVTGAPTQNTATQRIRIPSANVFSPQAVEAILTDIRNGVIVP